MFKDDIFEKWLDNKAREIITELGDGKSLTSEEMMILVLKAQSNHFEHLDIELREEMKELRDDMDKRFEQVDKRFEQVDKRFEQIDKKFEQVDKRFEQMIGRMDRFMIWSLGLTMSSTIFILGFMYKLLG